MHFSVMTKKEDQFNEFLIWIYIIVAVCKMNEYKINE